jgi:hypothetical protein
MRSISLAPPRNSPAPGNVRQHYFSARKEYPRPLINICGLPRNPCGARCAPLPRPSGSAALPAPSPPSAQRARRPPGLGPNTRLVHPAGPIWRPTCMHTRGPRRPRARMRLPWSQAQREAPRGGGRAWGVACHPSPPSPPRPGGPGSPGGPLGALHGGPAAWTACHLAPSLGHMSPAKKPHKSVLNGAWDSWDGGPALPTALGDYPFSPRTCVYMPSAIR